MIDLVWGAAHAVWRSLPAAVASGIWHFWQLALSLVSTSLQSSLSSPAAPIASTGAPREPQSADGYQTIWVALVSGLLGAMAGLYYATWQVAVESAQVLAGTVVYPYDTSFHTYHVQTWTLLHQLPALLLAIGMPSDAVSLILTVLNGALGFAALALIALAIGGNGWIALAAPLVYLAAPEAANMVGAVYPIPFLATPHTYGTFTINYALFAVALVSLGHARSGWFLLALAPAFHAAIGAWTILIAACGSAVDWPRVRPHLKRCWPAIVAGMALVAASFAWQSIVWSEAPVLSAEQRAQYLSFSSLYPDDHRPVVDFTHAAVVLNLAFAALAVCWIAPLAVDLPRGARFLLAALAVSGILAAIACWLTHVQDDLPSLFQRAMPGRYVNIVGLAFSSVVVGLAGAYWSRFSVRVIWTGLAIVLLIPTIAPMLPGMTTLLLAGMLALALMRLLTTPVLGTTLNILAVVSLLTAASIEMIGFAPLAALAAIALAGGLLLPASAARRPSPAVAAVVLVLASTPALSMVRSHWGAARERLNADTVLRAAEKSDGMLLTASDLYLVQARARRPVLLCGAALDMIPYVPEAGPDAERVLAKVYGLDLFEPEANRATMNGNSLAKEAGRRLWEARSADEWRRLADEFKFSDILVHKDWSLRLPLVAENENLRLFHVP